MNDTGVRIERSILREYDVMLAIGEFSSLFEAFHAHTRRWELELDGLGTIMMHQALAGAALQLSFRRLDEVSAWTVNIIQPKTNLFVAGGGEQSTLTGRYYPRGVETVESSRLFVQRTHPDRPGSQSVLDVEGLDVLDIYEQYFARSEQQAARLVELSSTEVAMVLALPEADDDWVRGLDGARIRELAASSAAPVDHRDFRLFCGCDPARLTRSLARMFAGRADEFFAGDETVEAICPRCGAQHPIDRAAFDRASRHGR